MDWRSPRSGTFQTTVNNPSHLRVVFQSNVFDHSYGHGSVTLSGNVPIIVFDEFHTVAEFRFLRAVASPAVLLMRDTEPADGHTVVLCHVESKRSRISAGTSGDTFLMSISGKFQPKPLLVTPAYEGGPQLSADGDWMLYQSNQSGQPEIYVRRYSAMDRQLQVSEGGRVQARWSSTSRESAS